MSRTRSDSDINGKGSNGGVQGWFSGSGDKVNTNISRAMERVGGLEEACRFNGSVAFGVGPVCKRSQWLNNAMNCALDGIAQGAFVVVAHEEVVD